MLEIVLIFFFLEIFKKIRFRFVIFVLYCMVIVKWIRYGLFDLRGLIRLFFFWVFGIRFKGLLVNVNL